MFSKCYNMIMKTLNLPKKITGKPFAVTSKNIDSAFRRRAKEIESLRQYDRGEKIITPSVLARPVKRV